LLQGDIPLLQLINDLFQAVQALFKFRQIVTPQVF